MYSRPSTEVIVAPCALRKKTGVPPTLLNARTGLCTPPGVTRRARSKYSRERSCESKAVCSDAISSVLFPPFGRGSPLSSYTQLLRIARAISNNVLRTGALEYVPGLAQSFFELDQALFR